MICEIVTADQARHSGLVRYYTGKPCIKGHLAERYVTDRRCISCKKDTREANRADELTRNRRWRQQNPIKARGHQIKYRYGITTAQYDAMFSKQGGLCAICRTPDPETKHGQFYIDHCHKTGVVRGLLCRVCNWLIGAAKDETDILDRAIGYLQEHRR